MGRAIFYCFKCSVLLREADFEKGKAVRSGDRVACADCAAEFGQKPTPSRAVPALKPETPARVARVSSTRRVPLAEEPASKGKALGWGLGAGAAVVLTVAVVLLIPSGPKPEPEPPPPRKLATQTQPKKVVLPAVVDPREDDAREAFRKAEALPADDLAAKISAFDDVVWKHERTKAAEEARQRVEALRGKVREEVAAGASALDGELRPRFEREEFGAALAEIEKAGGRLDVPEWRLEVDRRIRDVHDRLRPILDGLKAKAADAKAKGEAAELEKAVARVRAWGVPRCDEELKAALDAVAASGSEKPVVPPPPPSPAAPGEIHPATAEGKSYRAAWEEALGRAAGRDYEGALAALRKAAAGLQEEEVRKQAGADQEDVRQVAAFHEALAAELAKLPRHRGLALEWRAAGELRKSAGSVIQADADRVELRTGKESTFVEWSDASAASLAGLSKAEPRVRALFCLLEGEADAARAALGEKADAVAAKYFAAAAALKARVPRPAAEEVRARELFYQAEREWRSMETRGTAAEKYRSLRNDFAATATVGKLMPRVLRRSEGGKEYFFLGPDFSVEGAMRPQKDGRLVSARDAEGRELLENYAEFGFFALPGTAYRAWMQVGGCCDAVFGAYWQATELTDTDPQTRKKIAIEPGALAVAPLKLFIRNVKKNHDHKKEPKSAARWDWVELPLPRFASPGLKRVRILAEHAGFGVGAVLVSSTRKTSPTDAELKELEAARALDAPVETVDPDLIGYWSLDEGSGSEAADVSGHGRPATLSGVQWTDGKLGKALLFDGSGSVAEVPDGPDVQVTGDFTIAFWARKDAESDDWTRYVGKGRESERTFGIWEWPKDDKRLKFQQSGGGKWFDIDSTRTIEAGVWTHVAATMKGNRGTLYLNGAKDGEKDREAAPPPGAGVPLTFGVSPGLHGAFKGALDDIRLYRRALGDDEIRSLHESSR